MVSSSIWLPKGEQGDPGPQGPVGPQGPQGPQGAPGPDAAAFAQFVLDLQSSAANKGASLVGGAIRYLGNYAALRAFTDTNATTVVISGYANIFDGASGTWYRDPASSLADDDCTVLRDGLNRVWRRNFAGRVEAAWAGVVGDNLSVDYGTKLNNAIYVGCQYYGGTNMVSGQVNIGTTTLMGVNKGWTIKGNTGGTRSEIVSASTSALLMDLSGCSGPAKTIEDMGFSTTTTGSYSCTGIKTFNTNGLLLRNVWFRGMIGGIQYHGSFINFQNVTFEFNLQAIECLTGCIETVWLGTTFYKNETDVILTGDATTFSFIGSNFIGTKTAGIVFNNVKHAQLSNLTFADDGSGWTPTLLQFNGTSSNNKVRDVTSDGFGHIGVFFNGAGVTKNDIVGLDLLGKGATPVAGSKGVYSLNATGNNVQGRITGFEENLRVNGASSGHFDVELLNGGTNLVLNAANYVQFSVVSSGAITADVAATATTIIHLSKYVGNRSGLSSIPYILTQRGYTDIVYCSGMPSALSWTAGTLAYPFAPAVGSPKGWERLTTSSNNVLNTDWVSLGNL